MYCTCSQPCDFVKEKGELFVVKTLNKNFATKILPNFWAAAFSFTIILVAGLDYSDNILESDILAASFKKSLPCLGEQSVNII